MATPGDTIKFLGYDSALIDLTERKSTSGNSKTEYYSAEDIADWIEEQEDITADLLIISLLRDMIGEIKELRIIQEELKETNKYLKKIYNPE